MRTDDPNNYLFNVEDALRKNLANNKSAYRTFENFWKDFSYGLKDWKDLGEAYSDYCKDRLQKVWNGR